MPDVHKGRGRSRQMSLLGAFVAAGFLCAPVPQAHAQEQAPAAPAQPAAPGLTFEGDAGLILMQIKPDRVADFEQTMTKLHEALARTDKPERKQQAQGWKIYRSTDPGPGGSVLYVAVIQPTLRGADYTTAKILYEVFPTEVQEIFPLYRDSFAAGLNRLNLTLVEDFGSPHGAAAARPATTTGSGDSETTAGAQDATAPAPQQ